MILAGGGSLRMGRDKLPLIVGGKTLIERVAGSLRVRCEEVVLAGGAGVPGLARRVEDERPGEGPLAGMETGLAAARFPLVFVAAGDMPFLPPGLVGYLLDLLAERGVPAVVPAYGGRVHPLCAAYARGTLPHVRAALDEGVRAARGLLGRLDGVLYVGESGLRRFGDPAISLMNVNSPEDLARARRLVTP